MYFPFVYSIDVYSGHFKILKCRCNFASKDIGTNVSPIYEYHQSVTDIMNVILRMYDKQIYWL